jgi:hypothetical protein
MTARSICDSDILYVVSQQCRKASLPLGLVQMIALPELRCVASTLVQQAQGKCCDIWCCSLDFLCAVGLSSGGRGTALLPKGASRLVRFCLSPAWLHSCLSTWLACQHTLCSHTVHWTLGRCEHMLHAMCTTINIAAWTPRWLGTAHQEREELSHICNAMLGLAYMYGVQATCQVLQRIARSVLRSDE